MTKLYLILGATILLLLGLGGLGVVIVLVLWPKPSWGDPSYTNSIGLQLVLIPKGSFQMGPKRIQNEVEITRDFYMGKYTVTVGQFRQFVCDTNYKTDLERRIASNNFVKDPGWKPTDEHPVVDVTWNDAEAFCGWLSRKEGRTYRLPTEAEWEYSCRAGSKTDFHFGDDEGELTHYAWYGANSEGKMRPVGQKKPNAWGLYDMHGNVMQLCADWDGRKQYKNGPGQDPQGPASGQYRIMCGSSFGQFASDCHSARHAICLPNYIFYSTGFRVVCDR